MFARAPLLAGAMLCVLNAQPLAVRARLLIETKCAGCHGAAKMSGLDLRSREALLSGGKRGPAYTPEKANGSLLLRAIQREGELQMPPGKTALPAAEVQLLREWLQAGAPYPGPAEAIEPTWWSFRKIVRPPVPPQASSESH